MNINDVELNFFKEIMTSPTLINKSSEYSMLKNWLGDGLLLSTGEVFGHWKKEGVNKTVFCRKKVAEQKKSYYARISFQHP